MLRLRARYLVPLIPFTLWLVGYAVGGTGLLTGQVDWVEATRKIMRTEKPDVVVAIFVGMFQ